MCQSFAVGSIVVCSRMLSGWVIDWVMAGISRARRSLAPSCDKQDCTMVSVAGHDTKVLSQCEARWCWMRRLRLRDVPPDRGKPMSTITTKDGTEIFYKDWGSGQPIVFHHGWPLSGDDWDTQMLYFLAQGFRVIAHDRRGHG